MKVSQIEKPFQPVMLVLETQEEVNRVFACLNHPTLFPTTEFGDCQELLQPYISEEVGVLHRKLESDLE